MAASGLLAILDDLGSMLDNGSGLEQIATEKAAKIGKEGLVDDIHAANKQAARIDHRHEISVIMAIAKGALRNKVLFFIPSTFLIAAFAPWAVMPLCVGSGAYIAFEGVKRLAERKKPEMLKKQRQELIKASREGKETLLRYEKEHIAQAIKTDAALSLELTGFQIGMVAGAPLLAKLAIVGVTSIGATALLYATIIGIIGLNQLAQSLADTKGDTRRNRFKRKIGRGIMRGASPMLKTLAFTGMAALFFVGGHLLSAYIPGMDHTFAAMAKTLVKNPLLDTAIQVAETLLTGIAGGALACAGAKGANSVKRILGRHENAFYNRGARKIRAGISKGIQKLRRAPSPAKKKLRKNPDRKQQPLPEPPPQTIDEIPRLVSEMPPLAREFSGAAQKPGTGTPQETAQGKPMAQSPAGNNKQTPNP